MKKVASLFLAIKKVESEREDLFMDTQYSIVKINKNDSRLIGTLDLVWHVFQEFEAPGYSEEGVTEFKKFISLTSIKEQLDCGDFHLWICLHEEKVVGVIASRDLSHISLLFVDKEYHKKGIGKDLYKTFLNSCLEQGCLEITVNSSPYAVEIYQKLGFKNTDIEQTVNGIRFTPMKVVVKS